MEAMTLNVNTAPAAADSAAAALSPRAVRDALAARTKVLSLRPVRRELTAAAPAMPAAPASELDAVRAALSGGPAAVCPHERALNLVVDRLLGTLRA